MKWESSSSLLWLQYSPALSFLSQDGNGRFRGLRFVPVQWLAAVVLETTSVFSLLGGAWSGWMKCGSTLCPVGWLRRSIAYFCRLILCWRTFPYSARILGFQWLAVLVALARCSFVECWSFGRWCSGLRGRWLTVPTGAFCAGKCRLKARGPYCTGYLLCWGIE